VIQLVLPVHECAAESVANPIAAESVADPNVASAAPTETSCLCVQF
jgi:hypothetical protein